MSTKTTWTLIRYPPKKFGKVKCKYCGKFMGAKDFRYKDALSFFTSDSEFTIEKIEYAHEKCHFNIN